MFNTHVETIMERTDPLFKVEYLGQNQIRVEHSDKGVEARRSLFDQNTMAAMSAEKNDLEMSKCVFVELIAYINILVTTATLTHDRTLVELILPEEFWKVNVLKYMLQYAASNVNTRVLRPGYQRKQQIVFNQDIAYSNARLCINVIAPANVKENVSMEDNSLSPKEAYLKKIADYIGDQDIDHVMIVTKAGVSTRVDP